MVAFFAFACASSSSLVFYMDFSVSHVYSYFSVYPGISKYKQWQ